MFAELMVAKRRPLHTCLGWVYVPDVFLVQGNRCQRWKLKGLILSSVLECELQ